MDHRSDVVATGVEGVNTSVPPPLSPLARGREERRRRKGGKRARRISRFSRTARIMNLVFLRKRASKYMDLRALTRTPRARRE